MPSMGRITAQETTDVLVLGSISSILLKESLKRTRRNFPQRSNRPLRYIDKIEVHFIVMLLAALSSSPPSFGVCGYTVVCTPFNPPWPSVPDPNPKDVIRACVLFVRLVGRVSEKKRWE